MVSENPADELSEDEFNYIAAVIEDENYEFDLDEDGEYSLFTDWEGDGTFLPSITILHEVTDEQAEWDTIDELLDDYDWFVFDEPEDIENSNTGNIAHAYFYGARIRDSVREAVEEQL